MPVPDDEKRKHFEWFDDGEGHRQDRKGLIRAQSFEKVADGVRNLHLLFARAYHQRVESPNVRRAAYFPEALNEITTLRALIVRRRQRQPRQPLAILVRVLPLVRLVVSDDTPCRGARSSVSSHVPRDTAHYRAFDASLGICRGACSEGYPNTSNATSIFISNLP